MSLFVSHSLFGIGKIQQVDEDLVQVLFPHLKSEHLKTFRLKTVGSQLRRYILPSGTPCLIQGQPSTIKDIHLKAEGGVPHEYTVLWSNGEIDEVSEADIELISSNSEKEIVETFCGIRPGAFVSANDSHGFGKVLSVREDFAEVVYFHHPGKETFSEIPTDDLERVFLSPETRVFIQEDDGWTVGRITDCLNGTKLLYTVRFPNKKERHLFEEDLYVRCLNAHHSPVALMANRGMQTQFFYEGRSAFVKRITALRNKSQGLSSVVSSSVELISHQIRAAQQVLTDSVQRYILADEVGLGKTIEAGFVIRQTLLDQPRCQVAVLAPPHLVEQWQQELKNKFRCEQFSTPPIVLPYHQADELFDCQIELLVIDEAHNIFRLKG